MRVNLCVYVNMQVNEKHVLKVLTQAPKTMYLNILIPVELQVCKSSVLYFIKSHDYLWLITNRITF